MQTPNTIDRRDLRLWLRHDVQHQRSIDVLDRLIDSADWDNKRPFTNAWACVRTVKSNGVEIIRQRGGLLHIGAGA